MSNAGLIPERTADPGRAFHLWSSDGAVILSTSTRTYYDYCDAVTQTGNGNAGVSLQPHIDGYTEFGDYYPDLVFVLCERLATAGGEWFLVDGQHLICAIAGDPTQRALRRFLWDVKLEQGRPHGVESVTRKPVPSRRPVASRTCGGRLTVRRHSHQRLLDDAPPRPDDRQHLAAWVRLTEEAARSAPRFVLHPGDLLCLDNYRIFHGREPYTGYDRIVHKLWAWSDMAFGLPYPEDLTSPPYEHRHGAISMNGLLDPCGLSQVVATITTKPSSVWTCSRRTASTAAGSRSRAIVPMARSAGGHWPDPSVSGQLLRGHGRSRS